MIDRKELTKLLSQMTYGDWLYKAIKKELIKRGNWKDAPRGKPFVKGNTAAQKYYGTVKIYELRNKDETN